MCCFFCEVCVHLVSTRSNQQYAHNNTHHRGSSSTYVIDVRCFGSTSSFKRRFILSVSCCCLLLSSSLLLFVVVLFVAMAHGTVAVCPLGLTRIAPPRQQDKQGQFRKFPGNSANSAPLLSLTIPLRSLFMSRNAALCSFD